MYLSDKAGWGKAAHPLKVESETVEDFELSGRGLLARKEIQQGEMIVMLIAAPGAFLIRKVTQCMPFLDALSLRGDEKKCQSAGVYGRRNKD